jgi:hypothetical protein
MSQEINDHYGPTNLLSDCCGARAFGEVANLAGICSQCRDHAGFEAVNADGETIHRTAEPTNAQIAALQSAWQEHPEI